MYPDGISYSMDDDLASSEFSIWDIEAKPLLMGEFGAFKNYYPDIGDAAAAMDVVLEASQYYEENTRLTRQNQR